MTPRVEPSTILLVCAGLTVHTLVGIGLPSYDPTLVLGGLGTFICTSCAFWTFTAAASATWIFLVVLLTRFRREYSQPIDGGPRAALSWATWVTIARGLVISVVAGFALLPVPTGDARWLPGALYAVAALADRADGVCRDV